MLRAFPHSPHFRLLQHLELVGAEVEGEGDQGGLIKDARVFDKVFFFEKAFLLSLLQTVSVGRPILLPQMLDLVGTPMAFFVTAPGI